MRVLRACIDIQLAIHLRAEAIFRQHTANRMLHGPLPKKYEGLTDGCFREKLVIVVLVACLLFIGICPGWIADMLDTSIAPIFEKISAATQPVIGGIGG